MKTLNVDNQILLVSKLFLVAIIFTLAFASCQNQNTNNNQNDLKELIKKKVKEKDKGIAIMLDELDSFGMGNPESGKQDSLKTAIKLVEAYEWEKARVALNEYMKKYGEEDIPKYFIAICLMNLDEYAKAAKHFQPLSIKEDFILYDETNYRLGLCYYMFNSKEGLESARKIFQKLADDPDSSYRETGKAILDQWL